MNIGNKLYEGTENFDELQLEMALACDENGWCLEDGYEEDGRYFLIINPPYEPSLEELKVEKITHFKFKRDTLEIEPIEYNGHLFDYDEKARDRINAAIIALDLAGGNLSWTTADQKEAIVTANDLRGIIANVALRSNELHVKYCELKALVESASTKEELDKVVWL